MPGPDPLFDETQFKLISLIYESVVDPSQWPLFLAAFVDAVRAGKGNFAIRDTSELGFSFACGYGWPDDVMQRYAERYAEIDPWRVGTANWPESAVGIDTDLCPREEMEPSVAYREFYLPIDAIHGLGGTILRTSVAQSTIIAVRGASAGPFEETEKAVLRPLMPHLKRAALLHGELQSLRRRLSMFTDHLDRYSHAFYLTDPTARVLYANSAARELGALRNGLSVEDGRLTIASSREDADFRRAVADVAAGRGAPLQRIRASRKSDGEPYLLLLMPVRESSAIPMGIAVPAVSILVVDTDLHSEPDVPMLRELFFFTPTEARVAGKLALGQSLEEIAAEAKISVETVRTHLKRILAKTGTARQGELISLILRSVPVRQP